MNRPVEALEPDGYIDAVLSAYTDMPETRVKPTAGDRTTARRLLERGIPIRTVQTALALGSLRRLARPPDYPRLQPIRSLAYFLPIVNELLETPVPEDYGRYVHTKLKQLVGAKLKGPQTPTGARPEIYVSS